MTPSESACAVPRKEHPGRGPQFIRLPRASGSTCPVPVSALNEGSFEDGFGFDGSSMRGWKTISESDMIIVPDPSSAMVDPFMEAKTLVMICNVFDPITREASTRATRATSRRRPRTTCARRASPTPASSARSAEFFIFDDIRYDQTTNAGYYFIDSNGRPLEHAAASEFPNLGYKPRQEGRVLPGAPTDSLQDIRSEMMLTLISVGRGHRGPPAPRGRHGGQAEIDMRFDTLLRMADKVLIYKYIVKNVARRHQKTVTFMPKPLHDDNGTGMHCHLSLWKGGQPLFAGDDYSGLSKMALHAIGGS